MTPPAPIVALTPNLSLDRTLRLDRELTPGALHRVRELRELAGGKGVNLARAVRALGGEVTVAGFLAGWNGRKFRELAEGEGLDGIFEEVEGETRECHALQFRTEHPTEVNEPGPWVDLKAWRRLFGRLPASVIVVSGSLPPGLEMHEFASLLASFPTAPVVDSSGPALAAALDAKPALIAPNGAELGALMGKEEATIEDAMAFHESLGTPVLLSLGAAGAAYIGAVRVRVEAPTVKATNPVGSGDCLLGAFLWARSRGSEIAEALRWGVAAGSDNARRGGGGSLDAQGVLELFEATRVEGLG